MLISRDKFWRRPRDPIGLEDYVDSMLCPRWDPNYYASIVESMLAYRIIPNIRWRVIEKPEFKSYFCDWKSLGTGMFRGYCEQWTWNRTKRQKELKRVWKDDQQTFKRCCGKVVESAIAERLRGTKLTKSLLVSRLSDVCERDNRFAEKPTSTRIAEAVELIKLIVLQGQNMFVQLGTPHDWGMRVVAHTDTVSGGQVDVLVEAADGSEMLVDIKSAAHLGSFHSEAQRVSGVPTSPKNEVQTLLYLLLMAADESCSVPRFVVLVNPLLGVFELLDVKSASLNENFMSVLEHLGYRALCLDEDRCITALNRIVQLQ